MAKKNAAEKDVMNTNDCIEDFKDRGLGHITRPTIINFTKQYSLGKKVFGRWRIDRIKWERLMDTYCD